MAPVRAERDGHDRRRVEPRGQIERFLDERRGLRDQAGHGRIDGRGLNDFASFYFRDEL